MTNQQNNQNQQLLDQIQQLLDQYCEDYNINKETIINNPEWQDNEDKTFAMYLADNKIIPTRKFEHDPNIRKKYSYYTVREYLRNNQLPIPNEWYDDEYKQQHEFKPKCVNEAFYGILTERDKNINPEQQYEYGYTVAIFYASQGIIPPECWNHDPYIPNNNEKTVQDYLTENNKDVPDNWKIVNKQIEMTDEIKQMLKQYCERNHIENQQIVINYPQYQKYKWDDTFAVYLESKGIITPKEFQYNPEYRLYDNMTTAMRIANEGKIPSQYWNHNPELQNKYQMTVAMYLAYNEIFNIPIQWQHKPELQGKYQMTVAMWLASNGIIPPKYWEHDPSLQNENENTVAILLAKNKILDIPKQWQHDPQLQNNKRQTVSMIYAYKGIIPPQQWLHDPLLKDEDGDTVALNLAHCNVIPPKEWHHNPEFKNNKGQTLALILAKNSIIPSKEWNHNKDIKDEYGFTVQDYLQSNNIEVPEQWRTTDCSVENKTIIKHLSDYCITYEVTKDIIINNTSWQGNWNKKTFAMYLADYRLIAPQQFNHGPLLKDDNGNTVAIYLASNGIVPLECWNHDPLLQNNDEDTVAMILADKGIIPPIQWMHDINMINYKNESIRSNLYEQNYYYINNEFIKLTEDTIQQCIQTEILNDTCQICLNDDEEQYFIISNCNHKVCLQCFKEMIKTKTYKYCPVCRQKQWFVLIDQNQ